MGEIKYPKTRTFYVAYSDDEKVIHYGVTEPNQVTSTGQPRFETFLKVADCETKLRVDLKVTEATLIKYPVDYKDDEIIQPGFMAMIASPLKSALNLINKALKWLGLKK